MGATPYDHQSFAAVVMSESFAARLHFMTHLNLEVFVYFWLRKAKNHLQQ